MADRPHSINDHALGADYDHDHGSDMVDHDHDHDFPEESDILKPVRFLSAGIDIGSSSTQVAFSRLSMAYTGTDSPGYRRETLFLSPIAPTPFDENGLIDESRLFAILGNAFEAAELTPDDIETGVVILTGEAALRRNADAIADLVSETVGELVCAAAGDHMEARLSAHGSGAVECSRQDGGRRILLVDIGGATTKLAVVENGYIVETAALAAGGRLAVIDKENRIRRLDAAGAAYARRAGFDWEVGGVIDPAVRRAVASTMADTILDAITGRMSETLQQTLLTAPLQQAAVDGVMFAGGVGEYVYDREKRDFSDLGRTLGTTLRERIHTGLLPYPLLPPGECIRATVLGASEHSVRLSGDTIFISSPATLLPRRNLQVFRPLIDLEADTLVASEISTSIEGHVAAFDIDPSRPIAISLRFGGMPAYPRLRALAEGITFGLAAQISRNVPLYILVSGDIARSLGAILKEELQVASEVMVLDGIEASDFDFVDVGRVRLPSFTVPVTIKTLLFGTR